MNRILSQTVHKRLFKFILKRVIGRFLKNELDLNNFGVQLTLGTGTINLKALELNVAVF